MARRYSSKFDVFWQAYPKKVAKGAARKAWKKIKHPAEVLDLILKALIWQCRQKQWLKDGGQFIPYPASYINGERWLDERPEKPLQVKRHIDEALPGPRATPEQISEIIATNPKMARLLHRKPKESEAKDEC